MSCPSEEQLAAAAAGEHARAAVHAESCTECAALLAQQVELRSLARRLEPPCLSPLRRAKLALDHDPADEIRVLALRLPPPVLAPARRAELAAETLARADALPARRMPWRTIGTVLAAAAIVTVVIWPRSPRLVAVHWPVLAPVAHAPAIAVVRAPVVPTVAPTTVAPPTVRARPPAPAPKLARAATISGDGADFTTSDRSDAVQLRDGTISIDARDRTPVSVAIGDTTIQVRNAHVEIRAAHGVIVSAHAFAGSVERTSPESKAIISAGEVWTPAPPEAALAAFRVGWTALHDARNADALAAFERASDPVIAEEASFWAAIAAQRMGDRDSAAQRFRAFLDAYPMSTRADAARSALAQLP